MATYDTSVKKALLPEQDDLKHHKEHCSADPDKLATVGRALGHQVRIKRNDDEYGLYTVSEVRQENPDNIVRMGQAGRERLGMSDEFDATLDSQVPHSTYSDAEAEACGEFVERLDDDGTHTELIVIAPHGGDIEAYTDQQAERVASQLAGKGVSSWRCKGWHPNGAFDHWHITSTDIHEASFPLLNSVIARGFRYAVAFHGFYDPNIPYDILIGGLALEALKEEVKEAIEGVVGSDFTVHITTPDEHFGGDNPRNIVNWLTASGENGIQIGKRGQAHFISIQSVLDHPGSRPLSSPPSACHGAWPRIDTQSLARSYPETGRHPDELCFRNGRTGDRRPSAYTWPP
jgi:phage replication-related protein YjqB (UPF0714/DUF867 family)